MTRSIFDPTGGETEHSGSRNLGPDAREISQLPSDLTNGIDDSESENETIDMGIEPAEEGDAPQESDVMDDPHALMEGQPTDESDAPQD